MGTPEVKAFNPVELLALLQLSVKDRKKRKSALAFIAQLVEQRICNAWVVGSIPIEGSKYQV